MQAVRHTTRISQICIGVALGLFIINERFLLGRWMRTSASEFHPAATTAMVTAIVLLAAWFVIMLVEAFSGHKEPGDICLGALTGSAYLAATGLLIGIGQSGCVAWMLAATPFSVGIGILWYHETCAHYALQEWGARIRYSLVMTALFANVGLAYISTLFGW